MNDLQKAEMERIKKGLLEHKSSQWLGAFDERQRRLIANARLYAQNEPAGIPGHNLLLIIDKMAARLDAYE